jgi:hypothetical protein
MDSTMDNSLGVLKIGFEMSGKTVSIADILPSRKIDEKQRASSKYATIVASIREVGIIEPPVIHPLGKNPNAKYLLLDGHLRIEALQDSGQDSVFCLLSTDDETYTYNNKVNQVTPIQEHFMILNAIERGVSEERIARALKVDVGLIRRKRNLLNGICAEAVEMLKDMTAGALTIRQLKRVKPSRQVEIVEMMLMVNNFSSVYCEALIAATPRELLVGTDSTKKTQMLSIDEIARMEREMETLQRDLHAHEDNYGKNFLNLVVVRGYLSKLLDNGRVVRFLSNTHPDILNGFQQIVESTSLEG